MQLKPSPGTAEVAGFSTDVLATDLTWFSICTAGSVVTAQILQQFCLITVVTVFHYTAENSKIQYD